MKYCRLFALLLVLSMVLSIAHPGAKALSSDEIQTQIQDLEKQNEEIEAELAELEQQTLDNYSEMEQVVRQKGLIDEQVALLNAQILVTEKQISAYAVLIADRQADLDDAQIRYEALTEKNRERIRAMEENGTLSYWAVLFKASSFADFLDRLNMMEEIARADRQRLEEMDQASKAVAEAKELLQSQKAELEQTKEELEQTKVTLEGKRQESDALLADLVDRGVEYQLLLEEGEERLAQQMLERGLLIFHSGTS
jgi:peptidoglycan hydrolase CwlO-like protein